MLCMAAFFFATGLLAWKLISNNCFGWVEISAGPRNTLVFFGWMALSPATFASGICKIQWHTNNFPPFIRLLSQAQAVLWLPLLVLVPAYILLNHSRQAGFAPDFVKIPMIMGFVLSILMVLSLILGWFRKIIQLNK